MWTKICGVTNLADAEIVAASGATAVGLNFYEPSKRYVTPETAATIRQLIGDRLEAVGVFVNSPISNVGLICQHVHLNTVQFHGDESANEIAAFQKQFPLIEIIRAYRVGVEGFATVEDSLNSLFEAGVVLKAALIDAYQPGEFGGTGHQVNPDLVRNWEPPNHTRIVLAGGLRPDNVLAAIQVARPWGVDTASGVELQPGVKCADKVRHFVEQAEAADSLH